MKGRIIKGIAGFYYVHTNEEGILSCKARGIFRKEKKKPLVGDEVIVEMTDPVDREGNVIEILPRRNELARPACSNVDRGLIVFAFSDPAPNLIVLDKMIISLKREEIEFAVCFNKSDLAEDESRRRLAAAYENECPVYIVSVTENEGTGELEEFLKGKTTAVLGPSGAGKSSLINRFCRESVSEVGEISRKLMRGKNTTRHAELFPMGGDSYIMDTPGFTSMEQSDIAAEDLRFFYSEFEEYEGKCRFNGCVHINEPDCRVKEALLQGAINETRYENYKTIYEELRLLEKRRYK